MTAPGPQPEIRTFLIADVRGYTRFTNEHGDAAAARLADRFADLVEETVRPHLGQLLELRGDEALVVFSSARGAVRAAVDLRRRFADEMRADPSLPLKVGVGLDAGEAIPVKGGYRGAALNRAARLCSIAGAGEVFVSDAAVHLAGTIEGYRYLDRGEVEVKGFPAPIPVIQVVSEGEPVEDLPRFTGQGKQLTNVPAQFTPFVGRVRERAELAALLARDDIRLLTLLGPGGAGKTRLALQAAEDALPLFKDGVYLVALAPLSAPDLVVPTLARVLDVSAAGARPLLETIIEQLADRRMLLLLDNFEHVMAACAQVGALLSACPDLKVMVTSRAVLHLAAEHTYLVPSLAVPDPARLPPVEMLAEYDAVALFVARAGAAKSGFSLTEGNAAAVAEICRRLDGLPLAIELAAARIRLFPPSALLARLSHRLAVLTGGARDAPERFQTLRGTIAWSYSLLDEGEVRLFARLSVFAGGCAIEAADAVCNAEGDLPIDTIAGIESLVDKSLLRQEGEEEPRFSMLETIREYAAEKLEAVGESEGVRSAHAEYAVSLTQEGTSDETSWLTRLDQENDNLRAALEWAFQRDAPLGVRLAGALFPFWERRSAFTEAQRWYEAGLASSGNMDPETRRRLCGWAAYMALRLGDYDRAESRGTDYLALSEELGHPVGRAWALHNLGLVACSRGDFNRASELMREAADGFREIGLQSGYAVALNSLGMVALAQGRLEAASDLYQRSAEAAEAAGDRLYLASAFEGLGSTALESGDADAARGWWSQSLALSRELGDQRGIAYCLEGFAALTTRQGEPDRAATLFGAADRLRRDIGSPRQPWERERYERWLSETRAQLDTAAWHRAWSVGESMSVDEVLSEARETL